MDSSLSHRGLNAFYWYQISAQDSAVGEVQKCSARTEASNYCNESLWRNILINSAHYDETNKRAHDSQIVRAEENLKLSHGWFSYRLTAGTNPPIKALHQNLHRVWGLTHRRVIKIKEETIVGWCDAKPNQATNVYNRENEDSSCFSSPS